MCTEILGYMKAPDKAPDAENLNHTLREVSENPTEISTEPQETPRERLYYYIMQKALGVLLLELGALTIPFSDGDAAAFVMILFFALPLIFSKSRIISEKPKGNL